jgi:hypothetical protein
MVDIGERYEARCQSPRRGIYQTPARRDIAAISARRATRLIWDTGVLRLAAGSQGFDRAHGLHSSLLPMFSSTLTMCSECPLLRHLATTVLFLQFSLFGQPTIIGSPGFSVHG